MKTETELRKTWCPFARSSIIYVNGSHAANRYAEGSNHPNAKCIGFACSQCVDCGEVREFGPLFNHRKYKTPGDDPNKPEGEGWKVMESVTHADRWVLETGERNAYCGRNVGEALRHELAGLADAIYNAANPHRQ